jgi:membrane protease YdiL (CAAX protease family)
MAFGRPKSGGVVSEDSIRQRGVIAFLAMTFLGTWPLWFVQRQILRMSLVDPLAQLPTAFMPALATIVVRLWITREGFRDAGLSLRLRDAWTWYLIAFLGPMGVTVLTLAAAAGLGMWRVELAPLKGLAVMLPVVTVLLTPVYWGEEFGWTGYLRPRLFPDHPLVGAVATGVVWAVWHYPLAFLGYIEFHHALVGLAAWTGSFVLQQIALTWLYLRSDTVWVVALAHAGNNMIIGFVTGLLLIERGTLDDVRTMLLTAIPLGAGGIGMVVTGGFRTLARSRLQAADVSAIPNPSS